MVYRPPLHLHLLFHPASEEARKLAEALVPRYLAPPAARGLRVPVFLTPDRGDGLPPSLDGDDPNRLDLDAAQHTVFVVLADARMIRRVGGGTGRAWGDFTRKLVETHDPLRHAVLLVSLDDQGLQLDEALAGRNFIVLKPHQDAAAREAEIAFHLGVRALILLREAGSTLKRQGPRVKAPLKFFLSHAKADLDADRKGPVHRILEETAALPIESWYDAGQIEPTAEFTDAIKQGIADADLVIIFLTDSWAQSEWCRMEAAYAKEVATPILVVDALQDGEPRSFPYGGNARVVRWPFTGGEQPPIDSQARARAAYRLVTAATQESVTRLHNLRLIEAQKQPEDVALDTSPEAVHLAIHPHATSFLYPDPPLTVEEYAILGGLRQGVTFETPLMRAARRLNLKVPLTVAVSVSDSDALPRYGLTASHLRTMTDELHLYLLIAGLRIAYGGKLEPDKLADPDNFTLRLFNLVSGYRGLAKKLGAKLAPIINVAPWPLWKLYDDNVLNVFGTIADLVEVPCPNLGGAETELRPLPSGYVVPDMPLHQYAWGPAMTAMREKMTHESFARIAVGGKIEGYKGRYAGLIEEPLLSLRAAKPLFLVGALGGCIRLVIDLLEQRDRAEMTTEQARQKIQNYDELVALYGQYGQEFLTREEVAAEIRGFGADGPAKALRNGLTDEENRELFLCSEPRRAAELILTGLGQLLGEKA